jgi:hypothetical protein
MIHDAGAEVSTVYTHQQDGSKMKMLFDGVKFLNIPYLPRSDMWGHVLWRDVGRCSRLARHRTGATKNTGAKALLLREFHHRQT